MFRMEDPNGDNAPDPAAAKRDSIQYYQSLTWKHYTQALSGMKLVIPKKPDYTLTKDSIRGAFKKQCVVLHPDKGGSEEEFKAMQAHCEWLQLLTPEDLKAIDYDRVYDTCLDFDLWSRETDAVYDRYVQFKYPSSRQRRAQAPSPKSPPSPRPVVKKEKKKHRLVDPTAQKDGMCGCRANTGEDGKMEEWLFENLDDACETIGYKYKSNLRRCINGHWARVTGKDGNTYSSWYWASQNDK